MPPSSPELNALTTRFKESYNSVSVSHESKKTEEIKERLVNSGIALIQHLSEIMRFMCFPVLPGSAEAHII